MKRHPFSLFLCGILLLLTLGFCIGNFRALAKILFNIYNPPFSIIELTDIHAGFSQGVSSTESSSNSMQNAINAIIANKSAWNVKLVISAGDIYQGNTNDSTFIGMTATGSPGGIPDNYAAVSNYFYQLSASGISFFAVPGNHDCDEAGSQLWWTNMFTAGYVSNQSYFYAFQTNTDTHCVIYRGTVSGFNFAISGYPWAGNNPTGQTSVAAVDVAYSPQTAWLVSQMQAMPNYHWIIVAHFFIDGFGQLDTSDDSILYPYVGPGVTAWNDGLNNQPNLMCCMSGHARLYNPTSTSQFIANDGHVVPFFRIDTQNASRARNISTPWTGCTNDGCFNLYTIDPNQMTLACRTYNADTGQYVTNGTWNIGSYAGPFNQTNSVRWFHL